MTTSITDDAASEDRYARLEAFYSAFAAYRANSRNTTWRPVLEAFRAIDEAVADKARLAALARDERER